MPQSSKPNWKCRLDMHQFVDVNDDNPENRTSKHQECARCGKFKEIKEYGPTKGEHLGRG